MNFILRYVWWIISAACVLVSLVGLFYPSTCLYGLAFLVILLCGTTSCFFYRIYTGLGDAAKERFLRFGLYGIYGVLGILAFVGIVVPKYAALFLIAATLMVTVYLVESNLKTLTARVEKDNMQLAPDEPAKLPTVSDSIREVFCKHYCWLIPVGLTGVYFAYRLIAN
jgi:hypothetical protein